MSYKPRPLDTSNIELPEELLELKEELALNTHENWSSSRLKEGWKLGSDRNEEKKTTPCLVPYDELPEIEKDYDRQTATEAIKFILAKGFKILPPEVKMSEQATLMQKRGNRLLELIHTNKNNMAELFTLWQRRDREVWKNFKEAYSELSNYFIKLGEPLLAYDVANEGKKQFGYNSKLLNTMALALIRMGMAKSALPLLEEVLKLEEKNREALGLLGRAFKDLWQNSTSSKKEFYLSESFRYYQLAHKSYPGNWTAINLATMALAKGDEKLAVKMAQEIEDNLTHKKIKAEVDSQWDIPTLAEAQLILKKYDQAFLNYQRFKELCAPHWGQLLSPKFNARIILSYYKESKDLINKLNQSLSAPSVIFFSGIRIDSKNSPSIRFPENILEKTKKALKTFLHDKEGSPVYSGMSPGGDLLFLKESYDKSCQLHYVFMNTSHQSFLESTEQFQGGEWVPIAKSVWDKGHAIMLGDGQNRLHETFLDYSKKILLGLARLKAQELDTTVTNVLLVHEKNQGPTGVVGRLQHFLQSQNEKIEFIETKPFLKEQGFDTAQASSSHHPPDQGLIMGLLFADAVNFSKLSENSFPLFEKEFWGLAKIILDRGAYKTVLENTWGDALYLVFPSVEETGRFALELTREIKKTNWEEKGLPKDLNLRVALHAGPVHPSKNPITGKNTYIGSNVCKAARIEPITPPGEVFASLEFAALAQAYQVKSFSCNYVGQMPMAKGYGIFPTYRLLKNKESEGYE